MAAVPKRRISSSSRGQRRAHNALRLESLVECSNCKTKTLPYHVCPSCGHYRGVEVIQIKSKS